MKELKEKIEYYNHEIFDNEEKRKKNNEIPFKIVDGEIPIILSAPHCVKQTRNGKMKQAGIRKGFVILVVNDEKISTPEQLEKMVDRLLKGSSDNQYLVIKGFYPENGRTKIYAIDLAE